MKNDILEDRKDDWLAQEYKRENLRNNIDLDDAKKLKDEHYREHEGKKHKNSETNNGINSFEDFILSVVFIGIPLIVFLLIF